MAVAYLEHRQHAWFQRVNECIASAELIEDTVLAVFDLIGQVNFEENYAGCSFLKLQCEASGTDTEILEAIQKFKTDQRKFFIQLLKPTTINADAIYLLFEGAVTESYFFKTNTPLNTAKLLIHSIFNTREIAPIQ